MRYNATVTTDGLMLRACIEELSGVAGRQLADRGSLVSRLYSAWLDRSHCLVPGGALEVALDAGGRFVAYTLLQKGRSVRLERHDGEFLPGLALARLGVCEIGGTGYIVEGDGWFAGIGYGNVFRTDDFRIWEEIPALRHSTPTSAVLVGREVVLGEYGRIFTSTDGVSWQETSLGTGVEEVNQMAWDGDALWVAANGALLRVDWASRTPTVVATGMWTGLSEAFGTTPPFRALSESPGFALYTESGALYRHVALDAWPAANLVRFGADAAGHRFVTVDRAGQVWNLGRDDDRLIGAVSPGAFRLLPASFLMRGRVVLVAFGRLLWTDGDRLTEVHAFGSDVQAAPGLYGPVLVAGDGVVYRVGRI